MILFAIILLGAGAAVGAVTSASFGWNITPVDDSDSYNWNIALKLSDDPLIWTEPGGSSGYDFGNIIAELPNGTVIYDGPGDILIPLPPINTISIDEIISVPLDNVPIGKYCNINDSITIYDITNSFKIYDPDRGIWWVPVNPFFIEE